MLGNVSDKKAQPFSTSLGVGKDNGGHDPPKKVMLSERIHFDANEKNRCEMEIRCSVVHTIH